MLADDEMIDEQASEQAKSENLKTEAPGETPASSSLLEPTTTPAPLESGMETGQGADDEPELAIGDRHTADALPVSPEEARRMLGGKDG